MYDEIITVVIADDHPLIRSGVSATLQAMQQIVLVGEATDGDQAQQLSQKLKPDILLLDLNMPGPDPTETIKRTRTTSPLTKVLILTAHADGGHIYRMVAEGVAGYMLKDELPETIGTAIHAIAHNQRWFSQHVADCMAAWINARSTKHTTELSEREIQVLQGVAKGWKNARIAQDLGLSERTVRMYLEKLFTRLEVTNRTEAVIVAQQHGWL